MMNKLPKAYHNSRNGEIRFYAPWMKTVMICAFQASIVQNRSVWRIGELNRTRASALGRLNWKKFQITIAEYDMNSCDSNAFLLQITKTVQAYGLWRLNQKEFLKMIENWWRFCQKSDEGFWWIWEKMEGKSVRFLRIVILWYLIQS